MKAFRITGIALCSMLIMAACGQKKSETTVQAPLVDPNAKPLVKLAKVVEEPVDQIQVYSATIVGEIKNNIAPATPARISKINVEVGDNVRRGQILVEMDETTLSQQEMQLKNLETEFNRIDQLYKVGGVSKSEWDNLNLQLEVARKSLKTLKENTQLASPIDGVVTTRNYDNGDLYGGQPILVVQKIAPVKLTINVSEQYYSKVKKGDEVKIELDAYPGETFTGKVSLIYPTVDAMTHTFPVEVNVANQDLKLRPGMFARATLNLGTLNHVVVPDLAIEKRAGSGDRFVYVYNNGKVSYNKVELGQRLGDRYELISGVPNGAQVVIEGQAKLADGKEVEVKK
ncbi:MAG: efflux RND transporter periplasmic adaptor subunit [Bacteroidaceae bacterium]|nr:efflux RND transporter periplasmic adaptor subunit [Bacteroidaceae bacterium]